MMTDHIALDFFLRMVLAHLFGDFVLQTYKLALAKRAGWRGLLIHVSLVTVSTAILLYNSVPNWYVWTALLFMIHLFIDQFRTFVFVDNSKGRGLVLLTLDQLAHLASIMLISWFAVGWKFADLKPIFTLNLTPLELTVCLISLFIFAVWVVPIVEVELATAIMTRKMGSTETFVPVYYSDRVMGGLERLTGIGLIMISMGLFTPLVFLPRLYWLLHRDSTPHKVATFTKVGTSFAIALLVGFPIWRTLVF